MHLRDIYYYYHHHYHYVQSTVGCLPPPVHLAGTHFGPVQGLAVQHVD